MIFCTAVRSGGQKKSTAIQRIYVEVPAGTCYYAIHCTCLYLSAHSMKIDNVKQSLGIHLRQTSRKKHAEA